MNREINFRGKRLDNGEWMYGFLVEIYDGRKFIIPPKSGCFRKSPYIPYRYEINPESIGEYTGLKDVKNKEVYEDDIVLQNSGSKAVIEWSPMASQWWMRYTKTASFRNDYKALEPDYGDGQNYCQYIEVIGNIHENPELLP